MSQNPPSAAERRTTSAMYSAHDEHHQPAVHHQHDHPQPQHGRLHYPAPSFAPNAPPPYTQPGAPSPSPPSGMTIQPLRRDRLGGLVHEYVQAHDVTDV